MPDLPQGRTLDDDDDDDDDDDYVVVSEIADTLALFGRPDPSRKENKGTLYNRPLK